VAGDTIFDRYFVPIAADVEPGEYTLLVKMYNETGTLPTVDGNGTVGDGALLTKITVR
jgi:hypothetical protein